MSATPVLSQLPSFEVVNQKALALKNCSVAELLQQDQNRAADFTLAGAGLRVDFSKHLLDRDALQTLLQLAEEARLSKEIAGLLSGAEVNNTERRPALHLQTPNIHNDRTPSLHGY